MPQAERDGAERERRDETDHQSGHDHRPRERTYHRHRGHGQREHGVHGREKAGRTGLPDRPFQRHTVAALPQAAPKVRRVVGPAEADLLAANPAVLVQV